MSSCRAAPRRRDHNGPAVAESHGAAMDRAGHAVRYRRKPSRWRYASIMSRDLADVVADLDSLAVLDFDPMNVGSYGDERLRAICIELGERDDAEWWAPLLYSFMERLDEADLGSPGPIVHLLEAWTVTARCSPSRYTANRPP